MVMLNYVIVDVIQVVLKCSLPVLAVEEGLKLVARRITQREETLRLKRAAEGVDKVRSISTSGMAF